MKRTIILLLLMAASIFSSCKKDSVLGGGYPTSYYINSYMDVEEITAVQEQTSPMYVSILFEGEDYLPYEQGDERGEKFRELSNRYGDTHCYQNVFMGAPTALCNEFDSIEVISDQDFNGIGAGSSLGSVVKIMTASAKPYIESDYKNKYNWSEAPEDYFYNINIAGFHPVYGLLESFTSDRLVLLCPAGFYLKFVEEPAIKHHTFTITFREGEKELSCELECEFR